VPSTLPSLSRSVLGVLAVCLLLAGCADASKPVASENQSAPSSPTTQPSTSALSSTTTSPATSTSSTPTLPSETPTAEDILAERASQLSGDESAPDDPDTQLIKFLLSLLSPEARNSPAPEWLTQQQITQLSDELETLPVDLSSEVDKALLKYIEITKICTDGIETNIVVSECSPEFSKVCDNFTILQTQLSEAEVAYFSSLWSDIKQIMCFASDSSQFLNYAQEALERCSEIWNIEDLGGIFSIEFSRNKANFRLSDIRPTQGEFDQVLESLEECVDEYDNFCLQIVNLQTRLDNFPTWFTENYVGNGSDLFLDESGTLENTGTFICQSVEILSGIVDFIIETLTFSDTCQDINPFENEDLDEPSFVKLNMRNNSMVFLVQSTTDEELIEECFQIIQSICSNIKSLILKMEELAKIDEEFGELIEMYSSIETIYCDLADIFFQEAA